MTWKNLLTNINVLIESLVVVLKMIKKIHILGSTGSIGKQTLSVINKNKDKYRVYSLAAGKSIKLLLNQVSKFKPQIISIMN